MQFWQTQLGVSQCCVRRLSVPLPPCLSPRPKEDIMLASTPQGIQVLTQAGINASSINGWVYFGSPWYIALGPENVPGSAIPTPCLFLPIFLYCATSFFLSLTCSLRQCVPCRLATALGEYLASPRIAVKHTASNGSHGFPSTLDGGNQAAYTCRRC
jgi:hypothetical protein